MNSLPAKNPYFGLITSREMALYVIKQSAYTFWVVAAIQATLGVFVAPFLLFDAVCYAIIAGALFRWHSRIAAVLLVLLSTVGLVVTILTKAGMIKEGGSNVFVAVIAVYAAIRATEAGFKINGRFKETPKSP